MTPEKFYYRGTVVELIPTATETPTKYMLCTCHDEGYAFQVFCISGYYAGSTAGYIKTEPRAAEKQLIAVSESYLLAYLPKLILFREGSVKILEKNSTN